MRPEHDSFDDILGPLIRPGYQLAVAMLGDRGLAEDAVAPSRSPARARSGGSTCKNLLPYSPVNRTILDMGVRLTSKGQITIPKGVREGLGLKPGDEVEFVAEGGEYRLRKVLRVNPFSRYRGYLDGLSRRETDELVRELRGDDHSG